MKCTGSQFCSVAVLAIRPGRPYPNSCLAYPNEILAYPGLWPVLSVE